MMSSRFFHYALRTTDVPAARRFYAAVLGRDNAEVFQLHEQALARGARPHWLGSIQVADVDAAVAAFQQRGATPLGPKWVRPDGIEGAVLRDAGGAIVGVAKPAGDAASAEAARSESEVAWHLLNTTDVERAKASYRELMGWELAAPQDVGEHGVIHPFGWRAGEPPVGAFSDIANRPQVHPHWLFHFRVGALEPALDAARNNGGKVLGPFVLPNRDRIAVCDDPQGAAFALLERQS